MLILAASDRISCRVAVLFRSTAAAKMILYRAESGLFSRNPHNGKSCEIFTHFLTLGAQNDQQVTFNYLLAQGEFRISTLLAVLFAAGFAIGWLICGLFWLRVRVSLARAERKIKRLEHQIAPVSPAAVDAGVPAVKE